MTAAQLLALRELATVFDGDKPALAEAIRAAIAEIERLAEALRDVRTKLFERSATSMSLVTRSDRIRTSSPLFDAWYYQLGRIHPCAEFEEDADQFVLGDLVESFTAGMRTEAIPNMEREEK